MGLDISHNAWHGAYSAFMRWRIKIADVAGLGNLEDYEGFSKNLNPLVFDKKHPLTPLLFHSDCDGYINWSELESIIKALTELLPMLENEDGGGHIGSYTDKTKAFIKGCELALSNKQKLQFH